MFLTKDNLSREEIWHNFFRNIDTDLYSIQCHPKYPEKVTQAILKSNIITNLVETQWGSASIVQAELNLLAEGLKDPLNYKFILVSENCMPLYNFSEIYHRLTLDNQAYLGLGTSSRTKYLNLQGQFYHFDYHPQWFIFNRELSDFFIKTQNKYLEILHQMPIPDEHYFGFLIKKYNLPEVTFCCKTYAHMKNTHAVEFKRIDETLINKLKANGYLFMRKITSNTNDLSAITQNISSSFTRN